MTSAGKASRRATLYGLVWLALTLLIAARWRAHLWRLDAPANLRSSL